MDHASILVTIESDSREQTSFHVLIEKSVFLVSQPMEAILQEAIRNRGHADTFQRSIGRHRTHMRVVQQIVGREDTVDDCTKQESLVEILVTPDATGCILCEHKHVTGKALTTFLDNSFLFSFFLALHGRYDSFDILSQPTNCNEHLSPEELKLLDTLSAALATHSKMTALAQETRINMSRILKKLTNNSEALGVAAVQLSESREELRVLSNSNNQLQMANATYASWNTSIARSAQRLNERKLLEVIAREVGKTHAKNKICKHNTSSFWKKFRNSAQQKVPDLSNIFAHAQTCILPQFVVLKILITNAGIMMDTSPDSLSQYNADMHYQESEATKVWHLNKTTSSLFIGKYAATHLNMQVEYHR